MKIVCPICGNSGVWLLNDWVDATLGDDGVTLEGAGIACECRACHASFEVSATGFTVKVEDHGKCVS